MLSAWTQPSTQDWIAQSRQTLLDWTTALRQLLEQHGWVCLPSQTNFFCAMPPTPILTKISAHTSANILRDQGVKLRDAGSLGLPGWWRLSAQPPAAQHALEGALKHIHRGVTP
jgi:histidinol-phosphate aminotransferase